jgi:pyridoxamine 5'-phosphate oxidase
VLLKDVSDGSFRWVTNRRSRKGRELAQNPHASLTFLYFATRPRESQVAAWASDQSEPVADRATLERKWSAMEARFAGAPVPRPDHWGMYALVPTSIELWQQRPFRMHDRFLYQRTAADQPWNITRLCP